MSMRTLSLTAACLLALSPIACTAEQEAGNDEAGNANGSASSSGEAGDASAEATASGGETPEQQLRERLTRDRPNLEIASIRETPVADIYEVVSGAGVYYATRDGAYLFNGDLIDLEAGRNLTDDRRAEIAHGVVGDLDRDGMVVYEPRNGPARGHITVFTDTTCGYCRRLHEEVLTMVEEYPVEVRYAMYPRAGVHSSAADTLRNVWCADSPTNAMTRAKQGSSVPSRESGCSTPIRDHWQAAKEIGVRGTPYIVVGDDGPIVPGYRPKKELLSMMGIAE